MNRAYASVYRTHQLPAQMNSTIGRTQEIASAISLLDQTATRLLTLTGPGGVGKTRLALEIAKGLLDNFRDGIFFVPLAPLSDPTLVLAAIAQTLSITDIAQQSVSERLQDFLSDKELLLVLDNFEHVLASSEQLADLLASAPQLKLLVTSREALHLYGEHEYEVQPLDLPDMTQSLPNLASPLPAAVALFVERAQSVKPAFTLTPENYPWVAEICIQLDGLPLAIELAAARCKVLPIQAILKRLQSRLSLLTSGARNLSVRQQTLRNTLDWSYHLLTDGEKRFFCRLGVLASSWTIEAASAIALSAEEEGDAFDLLASLVDKSLVRLVDDGADEPRFLLLETIREYALDNLEKRGDLDETRRRHALFYIGLAELAEPYLIGSDQHLWLLRLDRESANFTLVMHWVVAHCEAQLSLRLASALIGFLQLRSSLGEARNWLTQVLTLAKAERSLALRARVSYGAGMLAFMQNDLTQASTYVEESHAIAEEIANKRIQALSLGLIALIHLGHGNYDKAYIQAIEGLHVLDHTDDVWGRGILHSMSGLCASRRCDYLQAQVHYKISLTLLRRAGDVHKEADVLVNVGSMMITRGKLITAHFLYQKALVLYQSIDDRWGQIVCLNGIGDLLRLQGMFAEARESYQACLTLATFLGARRECLIALWGSGQIELYQGNFHQGAQYLKECLRGSRELDYKLGVVCSLQVLADIEIVHGHLEDAQSYYEQSLALIRSQSDKVLMINNLCGLSRVALACHTYQRAKRFVRQAMQLASDAGNMLGLAMALGVFARLCAGMGFYERAVQFLGSADALRESLNAARAITYYGEYEREVGMLKETLGEEAFHENWMVGQAMTLKQTFGMIAQIHIAEEQGSKPEKPVQTYPAGLTMREVDVLRLVAQGLTDVSIAGRLVLSPRTVNTHLRSIYAKLGVSSRSAATRLAVEYKLV